MIYGFFYASFDFERNKSIIFTFQIDIYLRTNVKDEKTYGLNVQIEKSDRKQTSQLCSIMTIGMFMNKKLERSTF